MPIIGNQEEYAESYYFCLGRAVQARQQGGFVWFGRTTPPRVSWSTPVHVKSAYFCLFFHCHHILSGCKILTIRATDKYNICTEQEQSVDFFYFIYC